MSRDIEGLFTGEHRPSRTFRHRLHVEPSKLFSPDAASPDSFAFMASVPLYSKALEPDAKGSRRLYLGTHSWYEYDTGKVASRLARV